MRFRDKIIVQLVFSIIIFCVVWGVRTFDTDFTKKIQEKFSDVYSENYTKEEILKTWSQLKENISDYARQHEITLVPQKN